MHTCTRVAKVILLLLSVAVVWAQPADDITDHGVPVPASATRGWTTSLDGEGNRVVLVWLMNGGTRYQLVIWPDTGEARQVPVEPYVGDNVYVTWYSTRDLWYSHFGGHLYEFDPATLTFSFAGETPRGAAMSMHEDSSGRMWAALFPGAHLVSYDPATRELVNYDPINEETWGQYPTHLAVDDAGWVYAAIGTARGQVVGMNPETGQRRAYIAEDKRTQIALSNPRMFRGTDGKVYATVPGCDWGWHVLFEGEATALDAEEPPVSPHLDASGHGRGKANRTFPDGSRVTRVDLETRLLSVTEADGTERQVAFEYAAGATGVAVMRAGPDGKIYGSTAHPSRLFVYDPGNDHMVFYPNVNIAFKSLRTEGQYLFGGHYSGGFFWLMDTTKPLTFTPMTSGYGRQMPVPQAEEGAEPNPKELGRFNPNVNIPRNAFAHPDGKHIMISGQPGYGYVGGGLIIYNLETEQITELTHEDLLPGYSTMAIAALPNGDLLCGTSPRAGHGTTPAHSQAALYIMDWESKQVAWQSEPLEQMTSMQSMLAGPDGLYYCVGGDGTLLVFDADKREVVHHAALAEYGRHTTNQAMILGPDDNIYLALTGGLLRITPATFEIELLARPKAGIEAGLAILDGRIYFASGGHLMSVGL